MDRIDFVKVEITGVSAFTPPRTVTFTIDVTDQNSMFAQGLREEWAKYYDRLLASQKDNPADVGGLIG